ncbi:MAG: hypothetical protein JJE13_03090 [Thermoleophilia bacterium]|nr:hypothetical protein [Thermoleophilia bacterium]
MSRPITLAALAGLAFVIGASPAIAAKSDSSTVGLPRLAQPINGKSALLVPARYPLDMSGRKVTGSIRFVFPGGRKLTRKWVARPHGGTLRLGDRRTFFNFTHSFPIGSGLTRLLQSNARRVSVSSSYEIERVGLDHGYGRSEGGGSDRTGIRRAAASFCSTPSLVLMTASLPGRGQLPRCGGKVKWTISDQTDRGLASINGNGFQFTRAETQTGTDEFTLTGRIRGKIVVTRPVQIRINPTPVSSVSIRAMGDSVTAGFGYFGKTGKPMTIGQLYNCKPAAVTYNDACSSNAYNRNSGVGTAPDYLPDFGLSRNISWAAQWANAHGVTDYRNYAVSGSAPSDWLPGGQFDTTRQQIEKDNPDYIVMTMGANPLLSNVLFGIDNMGCALEADLFGDFRECIQTAFASIDLDQNLNALYTQLVDSTDSRIVLMQYHLAVPAADVAYSAVQIEMIDDLMNQTISAEANLVSPERIQVIAPPRFDVGIDMSPLYKSNFSCSWLGYKVDGPSVQATPAQDFLEALHPLSFCTGPAFGAPWTISGDTGIHPSATGYSQMAGQIPAPE